MIVFANGRLTGTTQDGDASFIKSIGENENSLSVSDETIVRYLFSILQELRKSNIHLQYITDQRINDMDITQEIE